MSLIIVLIIGAGYLIVHRSHASACTVSAIQVNSCRPLAGAVAKGNPGTPAEIASRTAPTKDVVTQFDYLQKLLGHQLDVYRTYHGSPSNDNCPAGTNCLPGNAALPLSSDESHFAKAGKILDINWNPAMYFKDAEPVSSGGSQYVNDNLVAAAKAIKAIAPTPVFFSPWHEINDNISALDPEDPASCKPGAGKTGGSPDQFKAAWINMHDVFKAQGVTNVIWALSYGSYQPRDCFVPLTYPGNQYVDWVLYDTYGRDKTFDTTAGRFYNYLKSLNSNSMNVTSKPWGLGEFGVCGTASPATAKQYYLDAAADVKSGKYPNLKMYLSYADTGNASGYGCLTDYDPDVANPTANSGTYDAEKQADVNQLYDNIFAGSSVPTPTPPTPTPPTPTPPTPTPPTPTPTPTPAPAGSGLTGTYYPQLNFGGTPKTRNDKTVDFNWCFNLWFFHWCWSPISGISSDTFSVRWTGQLVVPTTGDYTFTTTTDDGARLVVAGKVLVDQWHSQAATSHSGTIHLIGGDTVPIQMDYYQSHGVASAKLQWKGPGFFNKVIQPSSLRPAQGSNNP